MENINYNWLKNSEERSFATKAILSCFKNRILDNNNAIQKSITENEELLSAASILKEFNHLCVTIWKDSLYDNNTYLHLIMQVARIGKYPFPIPISEIKDDYLTSGNNSNFKLHLISNEVKHEIELVKGNYLDYNFLKLIVRASNSNNANGKFYIVNNESMETGFSFVYLDSQEYALISEKRLLELEELSEESIDKINIWIK